MKIATYRSETKILTPHIDEIYDDLLFFIETRQMNTVAIAELHGKSGFFTDKDYKDGFPYYGIIFKTAHSGIARIPSGEFLYIVIADDVPLLVLKQNEYGKKHNTLH